MISWSGQSNLGNTRKANYLIDTQQVMQGQSIVADGWAEAPNRHTHPTPHQTPFKHRHLYKKACNKSSKDHTWSAVPDALLGVIS